MLGGTYRIVRRIGSGGMGEVYEATHARLAHRYAVKFLHPGMRDHPEALPRFMREAQVTSRLRHPGIVSVVDFNTLPDGVARRARGGEVLPVSSVCQLVPASVVRKTPPPASSA